MCNWQKALKPLKPDPMHVSVTQALLRRTMPSVLAVSAGLGAALHDSLRELPDAVS